MTLRLRRQVQRARPRHTWAMALAGGIAINGLLLALILTADPPTPTTVVLVEPAAAPTPMPPPAIAPPVIAPVITIESPAAWRDLGPCPAPHKATPRGALVQPPGHVHLVNVVTSPTDSRLVAAWHHEVVFVSRDGGSSWHRVLDGEARVMDVGFDCHGRVLALRAEVGLGVRDGVREIWNPVPRIGYGADFEASPDGPEDYRPRLVSGGRLIAVIGKPNSRVGNTYAIITADGGASWWQSYLGGFERWNPAAAWRGDELHVARVEGECSDAYARLIIIGEGGTRDEKLEPPLSAAAFDGGVLHGLRRPCDFRPRDPHDEGSGHAIDPPYVHVRRSGSGWREARLPRQSDDGEPRLVEGAVDLFVIDSAAATVRGGRFGRLQWWVEGDSPVTADLAGRVWGLSPQGELIRR